MAGINSTFIKLTRPKDITNSTTATRTLSFFLCKSFRSSLSYFSLTLSRNPFSFSSFFSCGLKIQKNRGTRVSAEIRDASMAMIIV